MPIYRVIEPGLGRLRLAEMRRRAWRIVALLLFWVFFCAVGLTLLDNSEEPTHLRFLQGLWDALNLVTTLGDFSPFDPYQKIFMMSVMVVVSVIAAYAVAQLAGLWTDPAVTAYRENHAMQKTLDHLTGHTVVIGYVGAGRLLADRLREAGQSLVVIDRNEDAATVASEQGLLVVKGDAGANEGTLRQAGVDRAKVLIVHTGDPDRNLAITLWAHSANPALRIVTTARDAARAELLRRAGATQVIATDRLLADAMAGHLGEA